MRWKLFGVLLLSLLILGSFGSAAVPSNEVSPALAEKVAKTYVNWIAANIPDFEEWKGATLRKPITYYFPNGEKSAYEFAVFKNGKNVGFILISARKDMPPVLEFSKAEPPSWNLEKVKELAEKKGYKTGRLLYYGALTYSVDIGNRKAIGLKDLKVRKRPTKVKLKFNKEKAKKNWDILLSTSSDYGIQYLDVGYNEISGVPAWTSYDDGNSNISYPNNVGPDPDPWHEWDGCSPIAGAMVIGYYEPLLDEEAIIDILHHTMSTSTDGWTNFWNIDDGIDDFDDEYNTLLNSGIVNQPISHWFDGSNDWYVSTSDITREIDNSRPFILSMTDAGSSTDGVGPYGDHSVTVVGYSYWQSIDYYEFYLIFHNTWDSEKHYFVYGNWDTAIATYVYAYS